jgi:hypothetical protein
MLWTFQHQIFQSDYLESPQSSHIILRVLSPVIQHPIKSAKDEGVQEVQKWHSTCTADRNTIWGEVICSRSMGGPHSKWWCQQWMQEARQSPPKRRYPTTTLRGVTTQTDLKLRLVSWGWKVWILVHLLLLLLLLLRACVRACVSVCGGGIGIFCMRLSVLFTYYTHTHTHTHTHTFPVSPSGRLWENKLWHGVSTVLMRRTRIREVSDSIPGLGPIILLSQVPAHKLRGPYRLPPHPFPNHAIRRYTKALTNTWHIMTLKMAHE